MIWVYCYDTTCVWWVSWHHYNHVHTNQLRTRLGLFYENALNVHSWTHSSAHYDRQNTKVSLMSLFLYLNLTYVKHLDWTQIRNHWELIENLSSTMCINIQYILALHCDNGFLHTYLQLCLVQTYAAKGHLKVWLWRSRYWQSKTWSAENLLELVYFNFISHLCQFCTVHAHSKC